VGLAFAGFHANPRDGLPCQVSYPIVDNFGFVHSFFSQTHVEFEIRTHTRDTSSLALQEVRVIVLWCNISTHCMSYTHYADCQIHRSRSHFCRRLSLATTVSGV
jgi:hypothetical protein